MHTEEDDENALDFDTIKKRCFEGKVVDGQHLREHYNRIRRDVSYYMLSDLQSVVSAAKKEVERKLREKCDGDEAECEDRVIVPDVQ